MRLSLATSIYCSITLSAAFAATAQAQTAIISNGPVATTKQGAYQVRDGSFSDALCCSSEAIMDWSRSTSAGMASAWTCSSLNDSSRRCARSD